MIELNIGGEAVAVSPDMIKKYSRPGPRYTSYPTAPNWSENFGPADFRKTLIESNQNENPLSLYFHLPFCEERCTFCACSIVATKKRGIVEPYLEALFREIETVSSLLDNNRPVVQIHWGGGTPTYLNASQLRQLYAKIMQHFKIENGAEISVEVDPRVTTEEQLQTLREIGFNRVSLGLQDFEPEVQKAAGRIQPEAETEATVTACRKLCFDSINTDLVYGLPKQTLATFQKTVRKVIELSPERIALFHFAFVPWMHAHQRKINAAELPNAETKLEMFCIALEAFEEAGYSFIGLDHFAKKEDELVKAKQAGSMYRNFQGYTTHRECDLVGMGVTSISSVNGTFAQNAKKLKDYEEGVFRTGLTTHAGLVLSKEDLKRQEIIRELFCHQKIELNGSFELEKKRLASFEADGLVTLRGNHVGVTLLGRLFLRNIGMVFDTYLKPEQKKFSKTI